jgi:hypothetical protein
MGRRRAVVTLSEFVIGEEKEGERERILEISVIFHAFLFQSLGNKKTLLLFYCRRDTPHLAILSNLFSFKKTAQNAAVGLQSI